MDSHLEEHVVPEFWLTVCISTDERPVYNMWKRAFILKKSKELTDYEWFCDGDCFEEYASMEWARILDDGVYKINILPVWSGSNNPDDETPEDYKITQADLIVKIPRLE